MTIAGGSGSRESTKGSTKAHRANLYETPPEALPPLLRVESLPRVLWEPAAGRGALVKPLLDEGHHVIATDLNDWGGAGRGLIQSGVDFLMEPPIRSVEAIITNPPFNIAARFIEHALTLCPKVYMLLRLAFMEGGTGRSEEHRARKRILDGPWQPARIYVFRRRLPMMHRWEYDGPKANSGMTMAWFVWDASASGPAIIERISWHEQASREPLQGTLQLRPDDGDSDEEGVDL